MRDVPGVFKKSDTSQTSLKNFQLTETTGTRSVADAGGKEAAAVASVRLKSGGNEKENQGRTKIRSPAIRALKIYNWVL